MSSSRSTGRSMLALLTAALTASLVAGCAADDDSEEQAASAEAAFSSPADVPSTFPSESGWALAMVARACDLTAAELDGAVGEIRREDGGVVYEARRGGRTVASAWARSTFIGARKRCLSGAGGAG